MIKDSLAKVITIDGPTASGKGTIGRRLSHYLQWHFLESGALYRVLALAAKSQEIAETDASSLATVASDLDIIFTTTGCIQVNGRDVTDQVYQEETGLKASRISLYPEVRQALLGKQHAFRKAPGLVADGRDMGTVVFPDAFIKFYLTATPEERAKRRYDQLKHKRQDVTLRGLEEEIRARDVRDTERLVSPLRPAVDAILVDSTGCSADQTFQAILKAVHAKM